MKEPQFLTRVSNENDSNNNCVNCAGCGVFCFVTAWLGPAALVAALGVVTALTKSK